MWILYIFLFVWDCFVGPESLWWAVVNCVIFFLITFRFCLVGFMKMDKKKNLTFAFVAFQDALLQKLLNENYLSEEERY